MRARRKALGATLAADVVVSERPPHSIALRDGFAVAAAAIADAGPYAPMPFASPPRRIDAGEPLPSGTDSVAPLDAVVAARRSRRGDCRGCAGGGRVARRRRRHAATPLRRAGERLRALDIAVMAAAGVTDANDPIAAPRASSAAARRRRRSIDAALAMLARLIDGRWRRAFRTRKSA